MLGTIVNALAILCGGLIGLALNKGIPESMKRTVLQGVGLVVLIIGLQMALDGSNIILLIISILIGGLIGEFLRIDQRLDGLGRTLEARFSKGGKGDFVQGFVTASLMFCVGAMAIVGSIESGINNNHQVLFTKSILDMITCSILASTFGLGAVFSFIPVFIYQSILTLAAAQAALILTPAAVSYMSATGGLLIVGIAFNILEIKKINVANLLPAIFIVLLLFMLLMRVKPGLL